VLGCTEVGMLLNEGNSPLPIFDTTLIHADAAVNFALGHLSTAQAAE
jgi:aspartate racemase